MVMRRSRPCGMELRMPGARVVDQGRTSRDGYHMVVQSLVVSLPSYCFSRQRAW